MMQLKPCPFCGGEVSMALTGKGVINWVYITRGHSKDKKNCDCRLFMESNRYFIDRNGSEEIARIAREQLAEAWNKRATETAKHGHWEKAKYIEAPVYVCSECGNREPLPRKFCPECGAMTEKEERS